MTLRDVLQQIHKEHSERIDKLTEVLAEIIGLHMVAVMETFDHSAKHIIELATDDARIKALEPVILALAKARDEKKDEITSAARAFHINMLEVDADTMAAVTRAQERLEQIGKEEAKRVWSERSAVAAAKAHRPDGSDLN